MATGANFKFGTHAPRQSPDMTPEKIRDKEAASGPFPLHTLSATITAKGHSHCAPYGAAKQLLSALHRRRTAQHGAVRRRTALHHYAVRHAY